MVELVAAGWALWTDFDSRATSLKATSLNGVPPVVAFAAACSQSELKSTRRQLFVSYKVCFFM